MAARRLQQDNIVSFSDEDQQRRDQAGAQGLAELYNTSADHRHREQLEFYHNLHEQLEWSKWLMESAHQQAQAQRLMKYEAIMSHAIPELYAINPADPNANALRAQWAAKYPEVLHNEKGIPNATSEFEQHIKLGEGAERQRDAIQARKDAAVEREQARKDILDTQEKDRKDARADRESFEKSAMHDRQDFEERMTKERQEESRGRGNRNQESFEDALAKSKPAYGKTDNKGNFTPTEAGKDAQTHVRVSYISPNGSPVTDAVMDRGVFDQMVANSKGRAMATPPAAPTDTTNPNTGAPAGTDAPPATGTVSATPDESSEMARLGFNTPEAYREWKKSGTPPPSVSDAAVPVKKRRPLDELSPYTQNANSP